MCVFVIQCSEIICSRSRIATECCGSYIAGRSRGVVGRCRSTVATGLSIGGCIAASLGCRSSVAVLSGRSAVTAAVAGCCIIVLTSAEVCIGYIKFGAYSVVAFLVLPVTGFKACNNSDGAAFLEITGNELAGLPPGDQINEVGLSFAGFSRKVTVNGDGKASDGNAILGAAQFGISGQSAHKVTYIHHN